MSTNPIHDHFGVQGLRTMTLAEMGLRISRPFATQKDADDAELLVKAWVAEHPDEPFIDMTERGWLTPGFRLVGSTVPFRTIYDPLTPREQAFIDELNAMAS
jgi:hypothetical protein